MIHINDQVSVTPLSSRSPRVPDGLLPQSQTELEPQQRPVGLVPSLPGQRVLLYKTQEIAGSLDAWCTSSHPRPLSPTHPHTHTQTLTHTHSLSFSLCSIDCQAALPFPGGSFRHRQMRLSSGLCVCARVCVCAHLIRGSGQCRPGWNSQAFSTGRSRPLCVHNPFTHTHTHTHCRSRC